MSAQITKTGKTTTDTIHEANMREIVDEQNKCYSDRTGKQYGDFVVREVWYDWDNHKQMWKMQCVNCGVIKITCNGKDYIKGKNRGNCGCLQRAKREQIDREKKIARNKRIEESAMNPKWIGQTFGKWKVIGSRGSTEWNVECTKCGRTAWHKYNDVMTGINPKCRCDQNNGRYDGPEWVGKRFGNITIKGYYKGYFIGICDCGRIATVKPTFLLGGKVKTCGDSNCPYHIHGNYKHGLSNERLCNIWRGMIDRCYNPKNQARKYYLDRGISVCDEWRNDYLVFREWAQKNGYSDDLTIDRIDCDGNYEPSNCRWATYKEQANNKHPIWTFTPKPDSFTKKRRINWTIDGITKSAIEWCEQYGISYTIVRYRIIHNGMSPYEALTKPKQPGIPYNKS